jgi:putative PEP-CTERM system TPR-repeat lipoprotein
MNLSHLRVVPTVLAVIAIGASAGCTKQMKKARYLRAADKNFAAERYEAAEIEYQNVLRFPPVEPAALTRLGAIYYGQGKWLPAIHYLRDALKERPDDAETHLKLGLTYFRLNDLPAARGQALEILQRQPDNDAALVLLADCVRTNEELKQANDFLERATATGKDRAGYHLARGTFYLRQNDLPAAEREYRQAWALEPKSSEAHTALGNYFLLRQDLAQAEAEFKEAAIAAPLHSMAHLSYALTRMKRGALEPAKTDLQALMKKAPDFLPGWLFLAQTAVGEGKTDESAVYLQRVLAHDPANYDGLMLQGSLLLAKGDGTNAAIQFERLIQFYPAGLPEAHYHLAMAHLLNQESTKAQSSLSRALALNTNYADAAFLLANLEMNSGNSPAAIELLKGFVACQPQLARLQILLAKAYIEQRNLDAAGEVYGQMAKALPNDPDAPFHLAALRIMQKRNAEAKAALEKALELSPGFFPALEMLVELEIEQNRGAEALERINRTLEKYPGSAALHALRGRVEMKQSSAGALNRAESSLLKAIELDPNYAPAHRMLAAWYVSSGRQQQALDSLRELAVRSKDAAAWVQIGAIEEQLKHFEPARQAYEKAIEIEPSRVEALNNLAVLCSERLGQMDKAYELAERARKLDPKNSYVSDTLGWILFRRGEYERALLVMQEANLRLPSAESAYHLGMVHYALGQEEPARQALQRATVKGGEHSWLPEAKQCLALLSMDVNTANAEAARDLEQRLREKPNDVIALQRLAAIEQKDGALQSAIKNYELALRVSPRNPRIMSNLSQLYEDYLHNSAKALELARSAHALAPEDAQLSHLLGQLAFRQGDHKWARSLLDESARRSPHEPDVLYDFSWSEYSVGRITEAQAVMRSALENGLSTVHEEEAKRFLELTFSPTDPSRAESAAGEAMAILTTNADYVPALMVKAANEQRRENAREAAQCYERVLKMYPLFGPATRNLALLYFGPLSDDQRAYALANQARELFPDDPQVAGALGVLAYRRDDFSRAALLLAESLRQQTKDAQLNYYLGMAHHRLKHKPETKDALQRAVALKLPPEMETEANRVLGELK